MQDDIRARAARVAHARNKAQRALRITQEQGVRPCELLRLCYFDLVRANCPDLMHGHLMGVAWGGVALLLELLFPFFCNLTWFSGACLYSCTGTHMH